MTDIVPLLRNSERSVYKRCRFRWHLGYNEQWSPVHEKSALRFGTLVHEALAEWYVPGIIRGSDPAEAFIAAHQRDMANRGEFGVWDEDGEKFNALEMGTSMLQGYTAHWGVDAHLEVIAPEQAFMVTVKTRDGKRDLVRAVGRFDAIVRDLTTGKLGLLEHKTAKSIAQESKHLALDDQAGTYWLLATPYLREQGLLKPDETIDFILYNFLRKAKPDDRPQNADGQYLNKDGSVSGRQPPPFFERVKVYRDEGDQQQLLWRLRAEAWEMSLVRDGKLPIYKTPTHDCHWQCPFFDVCELHETGADWRTMLDLSCVQVDPYGEYKEALGVS